MEFRTQFAGKDMQDYISMVLIWFATQPQSGPKSDALSEEFVEALRKDK